ncbi:hypothetical protein [Streptomyces smyrnaeus]|uniref:hypothetical protein n=1 Tax=Streptomyces smyrnaeus TaxID=1387713 RepID=UPI0033EA4C64
MATTVLTRLHIAELVKESGNDRFVNRVIIRLQEAFTTPGQRLEPHPGQFSARSGEHGHPQSGCRTMIRSVP